MKKLLLFLILFTSVNFSQSSLLLLMSGEDLSAETKAYETRVIADGGTVINLNAVNSAYKSIKSTGIMDSLWGFWDANFGVKKNANNKVTKLYNLIGTSDLAQTDTALSPTWYADSLNGKATMKFTDDRLVSTITPNLTYGWSYYAVISSQANASLAVLGVVGTSQNYSVILSSGVGINFYVGGSTNGTNALRSGNTGALFTRNIVGSSIDPSDGNRAKNYSNSSTVANAQLSSPDLTWGGANFIVGTTRSSSVLNPFIGNISSLIMSKDVITEPTWLNQFYVVY